MADLKVGIVLQAFDRATAPLKGLSRSAGATQATLAKLSGQAGQVGKLRGLRAELGAVGSKLDVSRKRTSELGRELKRAENPSEKLRKAFERSQRQTVALARSHKRQKEELRGLSASLRKAGIDTRRLDAAQEGLGRTSERLRRRLDRLGKARSPRAGGGALMGHLGALGAYIGGGALLRRAGGFVETASTFETLETTLGTIEGSSEKARQSMAWIDRFAATTPFQLDQVAEAFVKLRAYGMEPTGGLLRSLGDTASAMGKDVMQAVEAIADAVTGENERLKEFGIKARTKGDTVTYEYGGGKIATANARDRADMQRVLLGIMDEQYAGAMEDRMNTFSGMVSNLGDKWLQFQSKVMESGPFEVLKGRLRGVLDRIDAMAASGELDDLASRFGQSLVSAFETFERDVLPVLRDELWPALRDDIWPALKDIAGAIADIFKAADAVAKAFGGWGGVLKGLFYYKLLSVGGTLAAGGSRYARGKAQAAGDLYGGIKDAVTSDRAKRLASGANGLARSGLSKLGGWLLRIGRVVAPFAMVALKGLGTVLASVAGVISGPVLAAAAAIGVAGVLIWKNWEPIKGFFAKLWDGVKNAFSGAWKWISEMDWGGLGMRLLETVAAGIKSAAGLPFKALEFALGKLRDLLPGSDARTGPLSRLTASSMAILPTMGEGVRRSGASALQRPLSRALGTAAAGLVLSAPAARLAAAPAPGLPAALPAPGAGVARVVHHHYRITIQQQPGESPAELADRLIGELERCQELAGREALGDAF